jgi:tetratricopeptide (TPR) repeat protein
MIISRGSFMIKLAIIITISMLLIGCAGSIKLPNPDKYPAPASESESAKITAGTDLHDQGKYQDAIKLYEEVLVTNPDNTWALYEIAYSCFQAGQSQKSLEYALRGTAYKSEMLGQFYIIVGNSLDAMGKPDEAIKVYEKAIGYIPNDNMLFYNLGITYYGQKKLEPAQNNFIKSLQFNQNHASSHLALAEILITKGEQIPALLLLNRFLILESGTRRSATALAYLENVMAAGVNQESENKININVLGLLQDNSPFSTIELFYKLNRATRHTDENKNKSELELRLGEFSSLLSFMKKEDLKETDPFLEKYLISYFCDLRDAEFAECCVYYINQLSSNEQIQEWIKSHQTKIEEFEKWNSNYKLSM